MRLHKKYKQLVALILSVAIVVSGVVIIPSENGLGLQLGKKAEAITCAWKQKANAPISLSGHSAVTINNKMYVLGGNYYSNGTLYSAPSLWEYTPASDTWIEKSWCPDYTYITAVINGQIYEVFSDKICIYNPATDTWITKTKPDFNSVGVATINGKMYAYSGYNYGSQLYEYNPETNVWTKKASNIMTFLKV